MPPTPTATANKSLGDEVNWTCEIDRVLPPKVGQTGAAANEPVTVFTRFRRILEEHGAHPALHFKRNGEWQSLTFDEYFGQVKLFARALLSLGFQRGQTINIIGFNAPEWMIAYLGTIAIGGVPAGVYTTNSPQMCHYVASHSQAQVVVCENNEQLEKYLETPLEHVKAFVTYAEAPSATASNVHAWEQFMELGKSVPDYEVESRIEELVPGQCCTLIYTSGTTGPPKAAMISHDNITWVTGTVISLFQASPVDRMVSYLPLSHIAAQMIDIHGPLTSGMSMHFADPDALKGTLRRTLQEVRPTLFFGVPRVYEKIQEGMLRFREAQPAIVRAISDLAKRVGLAASLADESHSARPWGYSLASMLVFRNVRRALGLDECRALFSGAAPLAAETSLYFKRLHMPIHELYGMSESTGLCTYNMPDNVKHGSVGRVLPGVELLIAHPDADGAGELCMRGRNVFMGYYKEPEKTAEAVDEDGWLHSGDLCCMDERGFVHITGRKKEIIVTAGGENVAPIPIEDMLKECAPVLSNAMVVGDRRRFLCALVTLKVEVDESTGVPTHTLTQQAVNALRAAGSSATTTDEAVQCPVVARMLDDALRSANARAVSRAQQVRRWVLLTHDFSVPGGELTPTLKEAHAKELEQVYAEGGEGGV